MILTNQTVRKNEIGRAPMRCDRFFAVNSSWYFSTRENFDIGPYQTKDEAKQGLSEFLEYMRLSAKH